MLISIPSDINTHGPSTLLEWTRTLELATHWSILSIEWLALRHLESLLASLPVQRLSLARNYRVDEWVDGALVDVCRRMEPPDENEMRLLDYADLAFVMASRESGRPPSNKSKVKERIRQ